MRITNSMMTNQFLSESNEALNRVSKYQSQVDSTKRLRGIADDPQATLTAIKARNKLSNLDLYRSNISTASSYLKEAESGASGLNDIIQSAYSDIISAGGAKTSDDLKALAEDVKNLRDEVLSISNATMGTSYIFGGYNYAGKTVGTTKSPPFSLNSAGELIYNGVNMSQLSSRDAFNRNVNLMSNPDITVTTDLDDTILSIANTFTTAYSDSYAMDQAKLALSYLDQLVAKGTTALDAAAAFGIDPASANYQAMSDFINGKTDNTTIPATYTPGIAYVANSLRTEISSANFSKANVLTILSDAVNPSAFSMLSGGAGSKMNLAISPLQQDIEAAWALQQPALDAEAGKTTKLQIGTAQSVDMTLTGLDLLGAGSDNIYLILDKAVNVLNGGNSADKLQDVITAVQNAQSRVLMLMTKVGATQNRMTLMSNRYDASDLNYTEMKSNAEDADMAESIVSLKTAQTVYSAALAGGAKILQTSLIDFLR